jgi:flagellar biogenesis protein FliO
MQTDYGTSLLSALLALVITAGLSYLLVRFLPSSRWLGRFAGRARLMEIEDTLRIDAKSTLMIVRVEGRRLLLASHSGAAPALISELSPHSSGAEPHASTSEAGEGGAR